MWIRSFQHHLAARTACLVGVLFAAGLLIGCPQIVQPPTDLEFTSADAANSRGALNGPDVPTDAAEGEGEDDGGDTPRSVVEPDVIRRVGSLLYILNQYRGLSIVDLSTNTLVAQVPTRGFPRDLYIVDDKAYVLTAYGVNYTRSGNLIDVSFDLRSRLHVVDISTPADAAIESTFNLVGDFIDSRLVGDVLYAVTANYQWWVEGGTVAEKQQTSNSRVISVGVGDPSDIGVIDEVEIPGYGSLIQASDEAIFVATQDWSSGGSVTDVQTIDISDAEGTIVPRGSVQVPGYLADRFKLDAYQGVLRIVSNTWWPERQVYVTTADLTQPDTMPILGQTTIESAAGDQLFATRFDGPRAYLVTYFMVDPLHVIDLSDPTNPHQTGELEVPGWSTHIEPRGDRLIALGVDDTGGQRRVSVSLFDVADPAAPSLLARESFGDNWAWSAAYGDVKAFTVLDDTLIVPFTGWTETGGYERLQFLDYTRDSLRLRGYVDLQGQVLRSFAYDDAYYAVTTEQLAQIDGSNLDAPVVVERVVLAENVADVQEISPGVVAQMIGRADTRDLLIRTVDGAGEILGEIAVNAPDVQQSFVAGSRLVLIGLAWDPVTYHARYVVTVIDLAEPTTPRIEAKYSPDVRPYWGGWWYDWYGPVEDVGALDGGPGAKEVADDAVRGGPWWWWAPAETSFLVGDRVALRCFADKYDAIAGSGNPQEGLALIDIENATIRTVGLAFDEVRNISVAGDQLCISSKRSVGRDLLGRGVGAFFATLLDPDSLSTGPTVNVPGEVAHYNAETGLLLLLDYQWDALTYELDRNLYTVRWRGGSRVQALDSLPLAATAGSTLRVAGTRVIHDQYDQGFGLGVIQIAADGELAEEAALRVSNQWGYLLGAARDSAYVVVAGNIVARYALAPQPALGEVVDVMAGPSQVRVGATTAYLPLGYAGVGTLPQ